MLGPGRYLLGVVELLWLVGFAWLGAAQVRRRWVPRLTAEAAFLSTLVIAVALLLWVAEALGTVSAFKPVPYLAAVAILGLAPWRFVPAERETASSAGGASAGVPRRAQAEPSTVGDAGATGPAAGPLRPSLLATVIALVIAGIAIGHFVSGVKLRLGTGMTGFDSTWYHGPFAAGFYQSGNTIDLHYIAPQFLAWFYPANSEVVGAIGMLAFSPGPALAAAEPRLAGRVPAGVLVHRAAVPGGALVPGSRRDRAQRPGPRPTRPGRRGTTSSGSSSCSARSRSR